MAFYSTLKPILGKTYRAITWLLPPSTRLSLDFWRANRYWPDVKNPRSFSEKVIHRKLTWDEPTFTTLSDKVAVRSYVKSKLGDNAVTKLYGVYDKYDDIDIESLPERFVMKCSHDSGSIKLVLDKAQINSEETRQFFNLRLARKPSARTHTRWYWPIPPKLIIEEYLGDEEGTPPTDYKFFVFNWQVKMIHQIYDRNRDIKANLYTADWEPIDGRLGYAKVGPESDPPKYLREMVVAAETLGEHFNFVRVDLYSLEDRPVVFGELTFGPDGGMGKFQPRSLDYWLGEFWV